MAGYNEMLILEYDISITELNRTESNITTVNEMTLDDLSVAAAPLIVVVNDMVMTLLLCLYMLSTREPPTEEEMYKDPSIMTMFEKITSKVKHYVVLKTALSMLTGGAVAFLLAIMKVRLFVLFGLMTFMLNFIPTLGSLIAMILPIPIIMVDTVDDHPFPEWLRKSCGVLLPALVQGYVGNILEPAVFGKSLNVTAISVLIALVLWGSIWGLQGAVLSVPLLAAMKIMLEEADHPLAKIFLRSIRESAAVDDAVEAGKSRKTRKAAKRTLQSAASMAFINKDNQTVNPMATIGEDLEDGLTSNQHDLE
jgi:predicted PurR-regulated permease PerM